MVLTASIRRLVFAALSSMLWCSAAHAQVAVTQRGYTPDVAGGNLFETTLSPATVSSSSFGRLFSLPVDGRIYAQPLYMPALTMPGGGVHNVLFIATMNDSVYAYDADTAGPPLWAFNYASAGVAGSTAVPIVDYVQSDSHNIAGPVGIESTPVIDPTTNTLYFVTNTIEPQSSGSAITFRLHAVDLFTGNEKFGGPVVISGSVTVAGKTVRFDPTAENQRPALVLAKGQVIVAFGSHEDELHYWGWVMAYNAATLSQTAIFNPVPTQDHGGAIWQSGRPPVVDSAGDLYLFIANTFGVGSNLVTADGVSNFSESVLKLDPGNKLAVLDYFTPANYQFLDQNDQDMSSSGPSLVPGTHALIGGGKLGTLYVLNTQNLGKMAAGDTGALQSVPGASGGEIHGGPVVWARSAAAGGPLIYNWGVGDPLKAFAFNTSTSQINTAPVGQFTLPSSYPSSIGIKFPGGLLSLSANGDQGGIVWAALSGQYDASDVVSQGELHAFNATPNANGTLSELWNSSTVALRDDVGLFAKFVPPVVTNGKVYMASSSSQVVVYGLLASDAGGVVTVWPPRQAALGGSADFVITAMQNSGAVVTATACNWSAAGLPAGATASFLLDGAGRGDMHIALAPATAPGTYAVQAICTAGSAKVSQSALLEVVGNAPASIAAVGADGQNSGNPAGNAIDGNPATFWATPYGSSNPNFPHQLTLDLGSVQSVVGLSYLPIQDGCAYGTILQYEVHVSTDGVNFPEVTGGSWDYGPSWRDWLNNGCAASAYPIRQSFKLPPTNARYIQIVGLNSVIASWPWAGAAEVQAFVAPSTQGFTLSAANTAPLALAGQALSDTIAINPQNGYSGAVSFSVSGLPPGAVATFSPASTTTSTRLSITTLATTPGGSYPIVVSGSGLVGTAALTASTGLTLTVTTQPTPQTISFSASASQIIGTTLTLTATATSGLPVSYSASTPGVCTVSGNVATLSAVGACTITASQAGNATYLAAAPVTQSFTVTLDPQTISFAAIASQAVGTPLTLAASASSGLPVSYSASPPGVCSVVGNTATFSATGTCTLIATQSGNALYAAAAPVTQSFGVTTRLVPDFSLRPATSTLTLGSGLFGFSSASDLITVTPLNGFNGSVNLSVSGALPLFWSDPLSPTVVPSAGTSTLTINPSVFSFGAGSYVLTITGTSGSISHTTTVTVVAP